MNQENKTDLLTTKEMLKYLGISTGLLHKLRKTNQCPAYFQPSGKKGKIYYKKEWLDEWIAKNKKN